MKYCNIDIQYTIYNIHIYILIRDNSKDLHFNSLIEVKRY